MMTRSYKYMTSEGRKSNFLATPEGLHVIDCSKYFDKGKNGCVFCTKITDYNNNFGNFEGIDTIKESKKGFMERDEKKASHVC